ncbi:glycine dehydrogenase (decarboxylating) alpha subunit (EC 1.4.4.2)/glycine dehydrogenase (decarboxylating) beta subunit (EC 1.4.4.2) [Streptoalloteichus tenebrarius]|uniref:Glycine dehydrogenase (decarboxylating) n=1 Tax=Streptoalloteichus tenebrarius (strain ATCC 17920 / DSM 40477 / JCM 4838 / CBS 697.72 / NBRC 16177 / NCIMB 11028 / NRRL B-12390 / A12253. 1 / ISP 5477) TaxID=1933 RepID=A0ABT1HQS0_STRSD|nr:aminomethyl-transferring glycine dehydrogenase [Streptoalloteichus tenebrarius]MCP2257859.1 glycine dehydrogenase (decarboxylating) alpha subunit (EC 1.4.4.2)/glycine dehydrogenase (decarboxylating) beta subunit (EC 1.4.4.2) [Streptoalloteichus tenebrarius]
MTQASNDPRAGGPAPDRVPLAALEHGTPFADRHVGPRPAELARMLDVVGVGSLEELAERAVPSVIRERDLTMRLPEPATEAGALAELRELARRNRPAVQMIGLGYHGTVTPPVILRNVLENPAWYTAYTPYQPEISQGRLEALLNFQTVVSDLTGLPIANASVLDEGTAAAEAMTLLRRAGRSKSNRFLVDADTLPQTIAVIETRAEPLGIEVVVADLSQGLEGLGFGEDFFGVLLSYPAASGVVRDHRSVIAEAHQRGAMVVVAADLLALTLLRSPGEMGADVAVGTTQRFGVPMGFGGPHAGYMAVRQGLERQLPGRLVGVSVDADGNPAYRLALQTREQHIRREKATSNICTAQALLAVVASMYAVYHGPEGLRAIATRAHRMATVLAAGLSEGGVEVVHGDFFDTVLAHVPGRADEVVAAARELGVNLRRADADHVGVACSETTTREHLKLVWRAFGVEVRDVDALDADTADGIPGELRRTSEYLTHPVFHAHRSETALLRYMRSLADKDIALDRSMIPLGSCTMKLNATAEMEPITWPEFADLHPFAPAEDAAGLLRIVADLERWLAEITGYDAVSLQPNAGSQGELAGLLAIRAYHHSRGERQREVCLIPASAHGTNAASAVMAGMRVVVVRCDDKGNIDMGHLRELVAAHASDLAAIMITYPSTHGVYEDTVREVCGLVHDAGGQVYVDGANLNALIGLAQYGRFGSDVSHLNLHKTFCIPHGGGGPGVGPIGVRAHLAPFLPNHPLQPAAGPETGVGPIAAAPWGSASILPISWAYVRMMGADGLRRATLTAVAAANYVARRLDEHYPVLYTGEGGFVAHECILDLRQITKATGVTVDDVAKRLADYGLHAPTMSFPVAGTLMIEPTESEDLAELDRFCDAMIAIRREIDRVASGEWPAEDNPLRNAPHTAACLAGEWDHPYTRAEAAFPTGPNRPKAWPAVRRIDGAKGDRNLVCSCPPLSAYEG